MLVGCHHSSLSLLSPSSPLRRREREEREEERRQQREIRPLNNLVFFCLAKRLSTFRSWKILWNFL